MAGENVGGTPVEGESSSNVPAGLRNLFAGGVGAGARFGMGRVSSNLGSSWDAHNTILGSVLDEDLTLGSTSPMLGQSTFNNTAPMLSSGGPVVCGDSPRARHCFALHHT